MVQLLLAAPLAFLVGISLGLLGGGGSILAVPIFVYVLKVPPKSAIASSLIVVGMTSLFGALRHAFHGNVRFQVGLMFGVSGVIGASLGSRVAALAVVPGSLLMAAFAVLMVTVSALMLRGSGRSEPEDGRGVHGFGIRLVVFGFLTGALTGLLGAGGGFIIVPVLLLVARLPIHFAIGTSLLIIALNCFSGLLGFLGAVPIEWKLAVTFAVASILGSITGAHIAARTAPTRLRKAFALFVLVAGLAILIERGVQWGS